MKPVHLPRSVAVLLLLLLAALFLSGITLAFHGAQAAPGLLQAATATLPASAPSPTPQPYVFPPPTDTTGILALGLALVTIILIGLAWGGRLRPKVRPTAHR